MPALLVLILLFVVMYAAMIRPQQKRAREHQALIAAVQVGDDVMTTAGIFGTVTAIEGDVISVEISPGVNMRVARAGIGRRLSQELEEFEAGETFDDVDDEIDQAVAEEPQDGEASTPTPTPEPAPTPPPAPPVPPPAAETPPAETPPPGETPPAPQGGPSAGPG
jgi:preprotein translocase subunit YajC